MLVKNYSITQNNYNSSNSQSANFKGKKEIAYVTRRFNQEIKKSEFKHCFWGTPEPLNQNRNKSLYDSIKKFFATKLKYEIKETECQSRDCLKTEKSARIIDPKTGNEIGDLRMKNNDHTFGNEIEYSEYVPDKHQTEIYRLYGKGGNPGITPPSIVFEKMII